MVVQRTLRTLKRSKKTALSDDDPGAWTPGAFGHLQKPSSMKGKQQMKRKAIPWWQEQLNLKTKAEVVTQIRSIVASYPNGTPISSEDQRWLDLILSHHYQYNDKVGCGIKHLEVRSNPSWNGPTRGLWIVRLDGSDIDISWVVALKPDGKPDVKNEVAKAARYEVRQQIHDHHKSGECNDCPLCGTEMQRKINLHVDHVEPFTDLMARFLSLKNIHYNDIQTTDLGLDAQFEDRDLALAWNQYHLQEATLRLTHAKCNLARTAA